jgi:hypothetical protein
MDRPTLFSGAGAIFPNANIRLTGVYGMRFKMKFKLQIAATPFHQGLLAMGFQYGLCAGTAATFNMYDRTNKAESITNLPHVRLDLSESTMCELEVPFLYPYEFLTLDELWTSLSFNILGSIGICTIVPVPAVSGITAPTMELYISLEDMEFFGAVPQTTSLITPQDGGIIPQAGGIMREQESDARPLSSASGAAATSLRFLAKGVPLISSIANTAAWWLDGVTGALRAWGYSKPQIKDPIIRVNMLSSAAENNVDIPSATVMCAPCASNTLTVTPELCATNVDEMSLSYVLSQWSQLTLATQSTSAAHASVIYATNVGPANMWFRISSSAPYCNIEPPTASGTTSTAFFPSHQFYWASNFRLWRGGFRYRFTCAKTKMHGGRVMVTYVPNVFRNLTSGATNTIIGPEVSAGTILQPFGYSAIYDLRDNNVFTFDVPYTANIPYLGFYDVMGSLSMSVMDPLQAPAVVANAVQWLVEVQCLPDFELAEAAGSPYFVHELGTVRLQSGGALTDNLDSTISQDVCKTTIGERLHSIKQLIMLPSWDVISINASTTFSAKLFPWFYVRRQPATVPLPLTTSVTEAFHPRHFAASSYVYACGGQDIHVYHDLGALVTIYAKHGRSDNWGALSNPTISQAAGFRSAVSNNTVLNTVDKSTHVRFPAYQTTTRVPTWAYANASWDLKDTGNATTTVPSNFYHYMCGRLTIQNRATTSAHTVIARCASDDARLAHYIGPVPLGLVQAGNTGVLDGSYTVVNT